MITEWRAVFFYPSSIVGDTDDSYGPWRDTERATWDDSPYRPEESHGWRGATESREVGAVKVSTDLVGFTEYRQAKLQAWRDSQRKKL